MDITFISIHDLSLDARVLYASNSVADILGYTPEEVVGKSCWEFFHPDEIPFARAIHGRGVQLDKAAVLNYCQIKNKYGYWMGCECVFTCVHDVMVACTSIYRQGLKSQKRAAEAPIIRQLFSSSPRDPRYHMLSYISAKFSQVPKTQSHEPRAALFLNRFTRTLTIMYATNGLADVLGISADEFTGKSFYYCIQENCLQDAIRCLESAKANDSIAYLRFWFRDPRHDQDNDQDETMSDVHDGPDFHGSEEDEDDGGVHLNGRHYEEGSENALMSDSGSNSRSGGSVDYNTQRPQYCQPIDPNSRTSSGNSTDLDGNANDTIFDQAPTASSSASSLPTSDAGDDRWNPRQRNQQRPSIQVELEAVVSCTSDGLVVILRRARPFFPPIVHPTQRRVPQTYANGLFASPWAAEPIMPEFHQHPQYVENNHQSSGTSPVRSFAPQSTTTGPQTEDFMNSIREVAVFAWALTGINGSLAQYSRGKPTGNAQPPDGLPIWNPDSNDGPEAVRPYYGNRPHKLDGNAHPSYSHPQPNQQWSGA